MEKTKHAQWNAGNSKEHYAIFAKSSKERIKAPGPLLFDLNDLQKALE